MTWTCYAILLMFLTIKETYQIFLGRTQQNMSMHTTPRYVPRGYSNYFWQGVQLQGLKPLPISKDLLPRKQLIWLSFLNFCKLGPISMGFYTSKMTDFFFLIFLWNRACFYRFFWPKWNPCLRIFGEKVTHLGCKIPVCCNMWVPLLPSMVPNLHNPLNITL